MVNLSHGGVFEAEIVENPTSPTEDGHSLIQITITRESSKIVGYLTKLLAEDLIAKMKSASALEYKKKSPEIESPEISNSYPFPLNGMTADKISSKLEIYAGFRFDSAEPRFYSFIGDVLSEERVAFQGIDLLRSSEELEAKLAQL